MRTFRASARLEGSTWVVTCDALPDISIRVDDLDKARKLRKKIARATGIPAAQIVVVVKIVDGPASTDDA